MARRPSGSLRSASRATVKFFLNLDNRLGALELLLQPFDLAAQLRVFERKRIGLDAALFRSESIQDTLRTLLSPRGEMRRVESFAANQCTALRRRRASVRFVQDALLVFRGELAVFGFRSDLGVR